LGLETLDLDAGLRAAALASGFWLLTLAMFVS
jgi:hypothetical protein